jgi:putative serine protease PepD
MTASAPAARPRGGRLVAGVAVLALLVGGGAGALGGYLVAGTQHNAAPVTNALDSPPSAKQTGNAATGTVQSAAAKITPAVVELQVQFAKPGGGTGQGEGSGIVISSDGLIMTNNHVIADAANNGKIQAVFSDGKTAPATVIGRDPTSDLAVVRAQGVAGLPTATLGRSDDLQVGQQVIAVGSPFDLQGTVTTGIVSSLHRATRAGGENGDQATVMDAIQTDAAINPGNSGGPLVDLAGNVIGINSAIYSPTSAGASASNVGIGFAIPIDQARRTADEIARTGKATQTVMQVQVTDSRTGGAEIKDVTAGGPADQAGLKAGDVIMKSDDRAVPDADALVAVVHSHAPGDKVTFTLNTGRTLTVTLAGQQVQVN